MLIINHPLIPSPSLSKIEKIEDIQKTPSNSTLWFEFDMDMMSYCLQNDLRYAVTITSLKEAVYANAMSATFIICNSLERAKEIQKVAEHYLFDSKVLLLIDERLIEKAIEAGIDGVVLK